MSLLNVSFVWCAFQCFCMPMLKEVKSQNQAQAERFWIWISNINLRSYIGVCTCVLILFNMCRKYFESTNVKKGLLINCVLCKIICAFTAFGCLSILINNQINNTSLISHGCLKYSYCFNSETNLNHLPLGNSNVLFDSFILYILQ